MKEVRFKFAWTKEDMVRQLDYDSNRMRAHISGSTHTALWNPINRQVPQLTHIPIEEIIRWQDWPMYLESDI